MLSSGSPSATVTTASTTSEYTMESIKKKSSKCSEAVNEPVVWFAFYSEAAGREYYCEPKSRTATWIMPDDYHPHPTHDADEDADADADDKDRHDLMPPKVKRKVSFQAGGSTPPAGKSSAPRSIGVDKTAMSREVSELKAEKTPCKRSVIGIVCIAIPVLLVYMGRESPLLLSGSFLGLQGQQQQQQEVAASRDSPILVEDIEVKPAGKEPSNHVTEVEDDPLVETMAKAVIEGIVEEYQEDDSDAEVKEDHEVQEEKEITKKEPLLPKVEEDQRVGIPKRSNTAEVSMEMSTEKIIMDKPRKRDEEKSSAPKKCKVPFAYIVSGECRRRAEPIFDAEAFSLSMMQ